MDFKPRAVDVNLVTIILDFNKYRIIQPTNNVVHFLDMVHDDRKHLHGT